MSYQKADDILPLELIELIQTYIDGEYLYIPRKDKNKKSWGENTNIRNELSIRDRNIYGDYKKGIDIASLGEKYYLSPKSIQRIVLKERRSYESYEISKARRGI